MAFEYLVSDNRAAQFVARFQEREDGSFLYFHPRGQMGGLPCSRAEAQSLIEEYVQGDHLSLRGVMYWAIASGIVLGLLEASGTLLLPRWGQYAIFLLPFPLMVRSWYHAGQRPLQLLGGRIPAAPPRSATSARHHRLAAFPPSFIIIMLLPPTVLCYYAAQSGWDIVSALVVACNLLMAVAWLLARRQLRAESHSEQP